MTHSIPLLQLAVQQAVAAASPGRVMGYDFSGAELATALTLAGTVAAAVTHAAHLAVNGWARVGGWEGLKAFLKTGNSERLKL